MNTMSESCVSLLLSERLNDTLKFGLPVTSVNERQALKQFTVFVAFCPNPTGRTSETSDAHTAKHEETFVAFWPNPDGRDRDVSAVHA